MPLCLHLSKIFLKWTMLKMRTISLMRIRSISQRKLVSSEVSLCMMYFFEIPTSLLGHHVDSNLADKLRACQSIVHELKSSDSHSRAHEMFEKRKQRNAKFVITAPVICEDVAHFDKVIAFLTVLLMQTI